MFVKAAAVVGLLAGAMGVQAQSSNSSTFNVTIPGGDKIWWVANSPNTLAWTCQTAPTDAKTFLVELNNTDSKVLNATIPLITSVQNFDCSHLFEASSFNVTPAKGYTILLVNPTNTSDVFAKSQEFEIKAAGALYPDPSVTSAAAAGGQTSSAAPATATTATTTKPASSSAASGSGASGSAASAAASGAPSPNVALGMTVPTVATGVLVAFGVVAGLL